MLRDALDGDGEKGVCLGECGERGCLEVSEWCLGESVCLEGREWRVRWTKNERVKKVYPRGERGG